MSGLGRVVRAGVARRRAAAVVTCLSTLAACAAAVAAAALLLASNQPFLHAFATQHGAQLTAAFDASKADTAQLAATAHAAGVSAVAGPLPSATATVRLDAPDGSELTLSGLALVGRSQPGGPVDDVALVSGHWVTGPGQIVLSTQLLQVPLGSPAAFPNAPGAPTLTVVGYAQSVTDSADAWVEPSQAFALADQGTAPTYQMLYRFARAGTDAQVLADRSAVTAMLPAGALTGSTSYLATQIAADHNVAPFVPFIVAFGVLALATAVLIITNVVSGAIGSALFKIGVLKALGATPAQVMRAYAWIALLPAALGVALGTVLGNVIATPLLHNAEIAYNTGTLGVPLPVNLFVPLAALALVALCALIPALRAGRTSVTAALAVGRAPRAGRGRFARRILLALPIPQPVGLGLGAPPTRPARYLSVIAALVFGTMALTFAVGLRASLEDVNAGIHAEQNVDVNVLPNVAADGGSAKTGPGAGELSAADAAAVQGAIARQRGTASYYGLAEDEVTVLGTGSSVTAKLYDHVAAASNPYQMIAGSWYTGPGQVVVPSAFLHSTGMRVGDELTLVDNGASARVRIVGEVLDDLAGTELEVIADAATFPGTEPARFGVMPAAGTDIAAYTRQLGDAVQGDGMYAVENPQRGDDQTILAMDALAAVLTLLVVGTAGLGVFNTVMLELRDRIRELGIYKAIGMTPKQTMAMVLSSTVAVGLIAAAIGVPAGIALHDAVIPIMGRAAGTDLPPADVHVFRAMEEVLLGLGGVVIALSAAAIPAAWAARLRTATALRTE